MFPACGNDVIRLLETTKVCSQMARVISHVTAGQLWSVLTVSQAVSQCNVRLGLTGSDITEMSSLHTPSLPDLMHAVNNGASGQIYCYAVHHNQSFNRNINSTLHLIYCNSGFFFGRDIFRIQIAR